VFTHYTHPDSSWTSAADGTLEQRRYYCQNWRSDVSAIVTSGGVMTEWAKFSAYGIPFGLPAGDTDSDGNCDAADENAIYVWTVGYDVRYDYDLDGDVDGDDETLAAANNADTAWNALSSAAVANRIGYAGYQKDSHLDLEHVRHRVYSTELGRWTRRDPLGYVDGLSLYEYVGSMSLINGDSTGLASGRGHIYADNPLTNTRSNPNKCGNYGLFGASCNACCYAQYPDSLDPGWLAACLGNCKGITPPAPGRVYPGTAGSLCEEICLRGGGHGASACWNGIKYSCNCAIQAWGGIPETKDSPKYDFSRCIDECEGLHQPNYTCPPRDAWRRLSGSDLEWGNVRQELF